MSRLAEAMKRASVEQEIVPDAREAVIREKPAAPHPKLVVAEPVVQPPPVEKAAPERETVSAPRVRSPRTSLSAEKLVVTPSISPVSLEQYRRLAATLHRRQTETRIKTVLVASTIAGEGKTLTAVNLALTFSESYGRNVLLIDGDLRRPTTHDVLDVPNILGSGDGLAKETDQRLSLIQVSSRLSVLTAGQPDSDPTSRLASDRVRRVLMEAAAQFDWVIVDTPPVGTVPDANLLATMADAVVLVIQAGKTPARLVQRTIDALGRDRVMGVVLNGADDLVVSSDSSSSYLYRPAN
jgi:capsular exopolysaccharide synthesis family protein